MRSTRSGRGSAAGGGRGLGRREMPVKPIRTPPDLARDKAARLLQKLQVVVVKDIGLALVVEPGQRQRAAFDASGMAAGEGLEIAFVRDPDPAEIAVELGPARIGQDRAQRGPRQAPPLRAQMRHQAPRDAALVAQPALQRDIAVEKLVPAPPGKGEMQGEAFLVQPADGPADILGRHAFDEVASGMRRQIGAKIRHRAQGQAGARDDQHMRHVPEPPEQQGRGVLRGAHQAEGAPFAGMARAEQHLRQVGQPGAHGPDRILGRPGIDMDRDRRPALGPDPRHAGGDGQFLVAQHDHAQPHRRVAHAQFPLEIRPRSSSRRQSRSAQDCSHQKSGSSRSPA